MSHFIVGKLTILIHLILIKPIEYALEFLHADHKYLQN
jgi:hypothetical protein